MRSSCGENSRRRYRWSTRAGQRWVCLVECREACRVVRVRGGKQPSRRRSSSSISLTSLSRSSARREGSPTPTRVQAPLHAPVGAPTLIPPTVASLVTQVRSTLRQSQRAGRGRPPRGHAMKTWRWRAGTTTTPTTGEEEEEEMGAGYGQEHAWGRAGARDEAAADRRRLRCQEGNKRHRQAVGTAVMSTTHLGGDLGASSRPLAEGASSSQPLAAPTGRCPLTGRPPKGRPPTAELPRVWRLVWPPSRGSSRLPVLKPRCCSRTPLSRVAGRSATSVSRWQSIPPLQTAKHLHSRPSAIRGISVLRPKTCLLLHGRTVLRSHRTSHCTSHCVSHRFHLNCRRYQH